MKANSWYDEVINRFQDTVKSEPSELAYQKLNERISPGVSFTVWTICRAEPDKTAWNFPSSGAMPPTEPLTVGVPVKLWFGYRPAAEIASFETAICEQVGGRTDRSNHKGKSQCCAGDAQTPGVNRISDHPSLRAGAFGRPGPDNSVIQAVDEVKRRL